VEPVAWRWRPIYDDGSEGAWIYEHGPLTRDIHTRLRLEHQPLYTRPSVVPDREALITLIASFPAHAADLGPDNTVFADHIPSDGAGIGECPKPIERLADAILSLLASQEG